MNQMDEPVITLQLRGKEAVFLAGSVLLMLNRQRDNRFTNIVGLGLLNRMALGSTVFEEEDRQVIEGSRMLAEDILEREGIYANLDGVQEGDPSQIM